MALFQRTTRRQLLTEEGEQFYHQCREALGRIREAEEALQRGKGEVQGRLRISLPVLFGPALRGAAAVPPESALSTAEARAPLQRPAGQFAGRGV